jgi:hypothetical protein
MSSGRGKGKTESRCMEGIQDAVADRGVDEGE